MLRVRGFGSLCLFVFSFDLLVAFYRHFLNVLSFRILWYFICTDIRLELLSLLIRLTFFLNELSFSMLSHIILTDIRLVLLSFLYYPVVDCGCAFFCSASFQIFYFLLLCWSFGTNWRARGRYCRCVGGSVSPWPSTTVLDSVAPCGGMTLWSAPM